MKKITLLATLVLCCAVTLSQTAVTNSTNAPAAPTSTSMKPSNSITKGSANPKASPTANPASNKAQTSGATTKAPTTTTPKPKKCYQITCTGVGCLKNMIAAANPTPCTGAYCKITQTHAGNVTTITASCDSTCTANTNTFCCQKDKCNNDATKIGTPSNSGAGAITMTYSALLCIQLMMLFSLIK